MSRFSFGDEADVVPISTKTEEPTLMIGFPGRIFDGVGKPLDGRATDLTQDQIDACKHRSSLQKNGDGGEIAPLAMIWLMDDTASFRDIPQGILEASVEAILSGRAILVLAHRPEIGDEIWNGLTAALELAQAPDEAAGHA